MSGAALRRLASVTCMHVDKYWEVLGPAMTRVILSQIALSGMIEGETIPEPTNIEIDFGSPLLIGEDSDDDFGEERVPADTG